MRAALMVAAYAFAAFQGARSPGPPEGRDQDAIRGIVKAYLEARGRGDESGVRALFTEDADQLTSSGEWRKGRDAIVSGSLASSQRTTGQRTIRLETIRFVAPGVALADGRYEIAGAQQGSDRRMWTSFVLARRDGAWRIAAIRNMLPAAAPGAGR